MHVHGLNMRTRVQKKENQVADEFEREDEERRELGESADATAKADESMGVLDATADDLDKDLTVKYHVDEEAPATDSNVDEILGKMKAEEDTTTPLDDATMFIQYKADVDSGMTNGMVLEDLAHAPGSLTERANIEAQQAESMDDEADLESDANDLGDAAAISEKAADLDAVTETLVDQPQLALDAEQNEKAEAVDVVKMDEAPVSQKSLGDIGSLERSNAVGEAGAFVSEEDKNEEAIIRKEQEHEAKMEESARKMMLADEKDMKELDAQTNADVLNAEKVH